jgi:multidrug transporter EmrE-like cation transporter
MSLLQVIGLSLIELVGDYGAKQFANLGGLKNLGIGIVGYIGVFISLIINLQGSTLLVVNNAWDGINSIMSSLFAFFILGERFESWTQYLGIPLIILGIIILKVPLTKKKSFVVPKI